MQTRLTHRNLHRPPRLLLVLAVIAILAAIFLTFPRHETCNAACVVLIGDSITSKWQSLSHTNQLSGLQIINHGLPGDTTSHMLSRFHQDVVQLRPRVVVILGGVNDLDRIPLPAIEQNLARMAEAASHDGIRTVLATLPPIGPYEPDRRPPAEEISGRQKIQALNDWIKYFADQKHLAVADYYSALADPDGHYQQGFTADGVHPTLRAYDRMEPLLREAIQSATRDTR